MQCHACNVPQSVKYAVALKYTLSRVIFIFILCLTVWGMEPGVTHQTSWLGSTGDVVCHKTRLVGILLKEEPNVPLLVIWAKQRRVVPPDDAIKGSLCNLAQHLSLDSADLHGKPTWGNRLSVSSIFRGRGIFCGSCLNMIYICVCSAKALLCAIHADNLLTHAACIVRAMLPVTHTHCYTALQLHDLQ